MLPPIEEDAIGIWVDADIIDVDALDNVHGNGGGGGEVTKTDLDARGGRC